jgi:hypothetical protein
MSNQHTPAPWNLAGLSLNDHEAYIIESESRTICWTSNSLGEGGDEFTSDEDQANARLIAAAPELLELAQQIVLERENSQVSRNPASIPDDIYEGAIKAIAKATNNQPKPIHQ